MSVCNVAFRMRTHVPNKLQDKVLPLMDKLCLQRSFKRSSRRVLAIFEDNRISISQMYPFLHYEQELDIEIRAISLDQFKKDVSPQPIGADLVLYKLGLI